MVNVRPANDEIEHLADVYCECRPRVEYRHPETGEELENGPLIVHNAADGREAVESGIGELLSTAHGWEIERTPCV